MNDSSSEMCSNLDFELYNLRAANHLSEVVFSYWDEETNAPFASFTDLTFITKDLEKFNVHSLVSNLCQA